VGGVTGSGQCPKSTILPNCEIDTENGLQIELKKLSFNTTFISFIIKNTEFKDIDEFLNACDNLIKNKIEFYVKKHKGIRVNICLNLKLKHIITNEIIDYNVWGEKNNEGRVILLADDHKKKVEKMINSIRSLALSKNPADTKFKLNRISSVQLNISKYRPLKGGKYRAFPTEILRKQAVSLIDNKCFNLTIKKYFQNFNIEKIINFDGIPEPTPLTEKYFKLFKKQNPDISINKISFDYSEEMVVDDIIVKEASLFLYPCYISKHIKQYDIDILFLPPDNNTDIGHYSLINDLSKLIRSQITNHKERIFLCKNCFRDQKSQEQLNYHIKDCYKNEESCIRMPTVNVDNIIEFKNYYNSLKQPIQIIFDFESILEKENKLKGKSIIIQNHKPLCVTIYLLLAEEYENEDWAQDEIFKKPIFLLDNNISSVSEQFVVKLKHIAKKLSFIYKVNKPMKQLTKEEEESFSKARVCVICEKEFKTGDVKVRDHDHLNGKYRGTAHKTCNVNYKLPNYVTVIAHNLFGYDIHLFLEELSKFSDDIKLFGKSTEKFQFLQIPMYVHEFDNYDYKFYFRFIDSYNFLKGSLNKITSVLDNSCFRNVSLYFPELKQRKLLFKKLPFPYSFYNNINRLESNINQITKEDFYDDLNKRECTDEEYHLFQQIIETFNIKTAKELLNLYSISDVLLLANVWENFVKTELKTFNLDPSYYISLPSLCWDIALKISKIQLELLTDETMLMIFEKAKRDGLSQCSKRYIKANNKYLPNYDHSKPSTYLLYIDANNLYGKAMTMPLPYKNFSENND
jgi:hypothetical protein